MYARFGSIAVGLAARRPLIDRHDVCRGDSVNLNPKIKQFVSWFLGKGIVQVYISMDLWLPIEI